MKKVCGWVGRILRVNLSTGRISIISILDYVPEYIGCRGIAARILWDELPGDIGPFDSENIPGPSGKRESLDREKFLELMDRYYQLRAWDEKGGWPKLTKLRQLGLEDVAKNLEDHLVNT